MKVLLISASPNEDGLTAACAAAAAEGVRMAGGEVDEARLNDLNIELCHACDDGWGACREDHCCDNDGRFPGAARARPDCRRVCPGDAGLLGRDERDREGVHRPAAPLRSDARRRQPPGQQTRDRGGRGGRHWRRDDHLSCQHRALDSARPGAHLRPDPGQSLEPRVQAGRDPRGSTAMVLDPHPQ